MACLDPGCDCGGEAGASGVDFVEALRLIRDLAESVRRNSGATHVTVIDAERFLENMATLGFHP